MAKPKKKTKVEQPKIGPQEGKQTLAWHMCTQAPEQKAKGNTVDFMIYGGAKQLWLPI